MNFREIFNNDRQKVRNIIRLVTKENADVCEDLEQEVYIKAFKNKENIKKKGNFQTGLQQLPIMFQGII